MESVSFHTMEHLFAQLGLPNTPEAMQMFVRSHQLPASVSIEEAIFWSESQSQFLQEQLDDDADWAVVIDDLNEMLHQQRTWH